MIRKLKEIDSKLSDAQKMELLSEYVTALHQAPDLKSCWNVLTATMAMFGFDRVKYYRKPFFNRENAHDLSDVVYMSSLGAEYDKVALESRAYLESMSVNWVLQNTGWFSLRMMHDMYQNDEMDKATRKFTEINMAFGVTHGITYTATTLESSYQSAYCLCFKRGYEHDYVEDVWLQHEAEISQMLKLFDITSSLYPSIPAGNELSEKQRHILQLAAQGQTISTITELTGMHRRTVDSQMSKARERLQVATTLQAAMKAALQGQIR